MPLEIEKKFLVRGEYKKEACEAIRIIQGYLNSDPERTVRVRIKGDKGYITVKGKGNASGATRFEWEKEIPVEDAKALLELAEPGIIDKTRYLIRHADGLHTWEVDEFYGLNEGLTIAEIELSDEDEPFAKPAWLGQEVTSDTRYCNSALARNPYKSWK